MANTFSGIFNQLAAAFNKASLAKEAKNVLLTMVTRDLEPSVAAPFTVINANIANSSGAVTDATAATTLALSDVNLDPGAVTLNKFPRYGFGISGLDMSRTVSEVLVEKLRDEAIKKIGNQINGYLAALILAANFPTNGSTTSGADTVTDAAMAAAWTKLAAADVAVGDMGNFFLATGPVVYGNLLQTQSWTQATNVGDQLAGAIRQSARLGLQWGAITDFDPDMPANGTLGTAAGTYASLLFHRHAMALVARALAPPLNTSIPCTYVNYKGIPIRITIDFNNKTGQDEMVFDALCGVGVIREDHGAYLIST